MGEAIEALVKWIGALAPFLSPYPAWVKGMFGLFVVSGAVWVVGLVVAAPPKRDETPSASPSDAPSAWLTIKGVVGFGSLDGEAVRVTAEVNGVEYIYPSAPGIDWLQMGPEMASQTFKIPVRPIYTIRFSAKVQGWDENSYLASVEEQRVEGGTVGVAVYSLRAVEWRKRSAPPVAEVQYTIKKGVN